MDASSRHRCSDLNYSSSSTMAMHSVRVGSLETDVGRMISPKISVDSSPFLLQHMGSSRCLLAVSEELH